MAHTRKMKATKKLSDEESSSLIALLRTKRLYQHAGLEHKSSIMTGFAMGYFGLVAYDYQRDNLDWPNFDEQLELSLATKIARWQQAPHPSANTQSQQASELEQMRQPIIANGWRNHEIERMADISLWQAAASCGEHDTEMRAALVEVVDIVIRPRISSEGVWRTHFYNNASPLPAMV
ncbi:hypothetical protein LTR97_003220 [Elasticomyces elasticus]|uniref:Uncharacterized protein n=1 Tax=Elasticomyces elasticus TaxID=574655 RepID=A0AAN7W9N9_9PEZI|nr:hypothetical protein LTR97_003220 [Elasticomyces elasticus]